MNIELSNRFLLMIFGTLVGIFVVGYIRPEPMSSVIQKERFWSTKTHSEKTYDVIFAGDSRVYRGIDPSSVSEKLNGLKVLNFGFSSGGHNQLIFQEIEKRFDQKSKHKIIVLGLTPYSLTKKAQKNKHFLQEKGRDSREVLFRRYINPALSFFDPIKPTDFIYMNDTAYGYYEKFRPDGWVESKKIPYNDKAALKGYIKDFKGNKIDSTVVQKVLDQVGRWRDQDILVFAVRMPTTKAMETLENELSGYSEEDLKRAINMVGGYWLDIENQEEYISYDGSHLDGESAKLISLYLGQKLSQFID